MKNIALNIGGREVLTPDTVPHSIAPSDIVNFILQIFGAIGSILAIIFIIYAGYLWATSGGDKQKVEAARATLSYTIIGIVIMILAFVIVMFIGALLGVKLF